MKKTHFYTITSLFSLVFDLSFAAAARLFSSAEFVKALGPVTATGSFLVLIYRPCRAFLSLKTLSLNDISETPASMHEVVMTVPRLRQGRVFISELTCRKDVCTGNYLTAPGIFCGRG